MSSQNSQLEQNLYDGAATAGRGMSLIALIIGILVSIILCIVGGVLLSSSTDSEWTSVYATVTNSPCSSSSSSSSINSCVLMLSYTAGTVKMTNIPLSVTDTSIYVTGSTIEIQYENSDPSIIRYAESSSTTAGIVLSAIAAVVTLIVVAQYFLTRKSKVYAAASGVSGLVNIFRRKR